MKEYPVFIFAALITFLFGLFSRLSERSPISSPMVFVSMGILAGPIGFDFMELGMKSTPVRVLAEITLVLVLFADASTINVRELARRKNLPFRLLFIGLPLTMVLGLALAVPLFREVSFWSAALMAFILSPTDAALGLPVVKSTFVPRHIREAINVESGLNDGIVLPPIIACIAALSVSPAVSGDARFWIVFVLKQFAFGPLLGGLVGLVGGKLVEKAATKGWMNETYQRLAGYSLALLAFGLAEEFHGNGFIAAFFGGLLVRGQAKEVSERMEEFEEAEGQQLALLIFLMFGLSAIPQAIPYWDLRAWFYAVMSLTVIRMLPVALALKGTKMNRFSVAFIGWFGPRGIASVLYLLIMANELGVTGNERVLSVIILTVSLSIILHGISAAPLSRLYASSVSKK